MGKDEWRAIGVTAWVTIMSMIFILVASYSHYTPRDHNAFKPILLAIMVAMGATIVQIGVVEWVRRR